MGYVAPGGRIAGGRVRFRGHDILDLPSADLMALRGSSIALVGQQPMSALNPSLRIGPQLDEVVEIHIGAGRRAARAASADMLARVRFRDPARILESFPHQLSGGQAQRVVLAMALLGEPSLLVLDEPTTALDATVEAEILALAARLRAETRMALLFVSHDINLVERITDRVAVMAGGRILEQGDTQRIFAKPSKYYTRALIAASPNIDRPTERDPTTPGVEVLSIAEAEKSYRRRGAFGGRGKGRLVRAARGVSLTVCAGETVALIGESGSGKSTLAKIATGLETVDGGAVFLLRQEVGKLSVSNRPRDVVRVAQMVFQNPESTLTPTRKIGKQIARAVKKLGAERGRDEIRYRASQLMAEAHLAPELAERYPDQLSGGEKQRVAIARARAGGPALLVADEPVSALDVTVQKAVLDVIDESRRVRGTAVLLISHDLAVVRNYADRISVMFEGTIMEQGTTAQVFSPPYHPYTRLLLAAARGELAETAEIADAAPIEGCAFCMRCPFAIQGKCDVEAPPRRQGTRGHSILCHLPIKDLSEPA
jgi:oligopeptide/dipeptide ABC transporter ATP-binding protein